MLFSPEASIWTAEAVASALSVSVSSAYRYLQDLCGAGLLNPTHGRGYTLGPAIVELDLLVRRHDELIGAAAPIMQRLLTQTTQSATVVLCRRYRDRVICIHQEHGSLPHPPTAYERGVSMPLFVGATSKVIMAHESLRIQRRTYLENEPSIRQKAKVADWQAFKALTAIIRQRGYDETESEITAGIRAIAAPIFSQNQVTASISLIFASATAAKLPMCGSFPEVIKLAAKHISDEMGA